MSRFRFRRRTCTLERSKEEAIPGLPYKSYERRSFRRPAIIFNDCVKRLRKDRVKCFDYFARRRDHLTSTCDRLHTHLDRHYVEIRPLLYSRVIVQTRNNGILYLMRLRVSTY